MCYNAPVSFGTFFFALGICGILWIRNKGLDRPIGLILLVVALMQLVEGGLWLTPDCTKTNQVLSFLIPLILFLQPLLINAIVAWFSAGWGIGYGAIAIGFLCFLPFQLYRIGQQYGACVTQDANGHLDWSSVLGPTTDPIGLLPTLLYDMAMIYPFVTLKNPLFGGLYIGLSLVSRIGFESLFSKTWPSLWCHFVNLLGVFALLQ
jgi:hypothetical protein